MYTDLVYTLFSPCRKRSPAKGVWQKSDEKSDKSVRKSDRKVTESVPKTKKSDGTPFAALLLQHPDFPLFSQENGIHHSFFCSVTSGSGDRPRKEGCHGGGVYSLLRSSEAVLLKRSIPPVLLAWRRRGRALRAVSEQGPSLGCFSRPLRASKLAPWSLD